MEVQVTGDLYHREDPDCHIANQSSSQKSGTVETLMPKEQADEQGYDPCPDCFPIESEE